MTSPNGRDQLVELIHKAHRQRWLRLFPIGPDQIPVAPLDDDFAATVADAIIVAGWQPRQEWLMGSGGTGENVEVPVADQPLTFEIIGHGEGGRRGQPRWRSIVKGLTYEQANAIVVEHNR